jgi:hypothetical protein
VINGPLLTEYILDLIVNSCDHLAVWYGLAGPSYLLTNQKNIDKLSVLAITMVSVLRPAMLTLPNRFPNHTFQLTTIKPQIRCGARSATPETREWKEYIKQMCQTLDTWSAVTWPRELTSFRPLLPRQNCPTPYQFPQLQRNHLCTSNSKRSAQRDARNSLLSKWSVNGGVRFWLVTCLKPVCLKPP